MSAAYGIALPVAELEGLSREDWLEIRRDGIGGSEIAALLGLSPWAGPLSVWMDKTGRAEPAEENLHMALGSELEGLVARKLAERLGLAIEKPAHLLRHPEHDWAFANPDGFAWDPRRADPGIFEAKTSGSGDGWDGGEAEGEIPPAYACQVQWYLAVTGLSWAIIAVLIHGRRPELRWRYIERDDLAIGLMLEAAARFWEAVLLDAPPEPAGPPASDLAALSSLYPDAIPGASADISELAEDVRIYRAAKAEAREAEELAKEAAARIRAALGDAELGLIGGEPAVTLKSQKGSPSTNWEAIAAALDISEAEARARFQSQAQTRILRIKKGAGA